MKWIDQLFLHLREGKNAFILTGDIGDSFPHLTDRQDDLLPWHEVLGAALRSAHPQALSWTFDPAFGFCFTKKTEARASAKDDDQEGKSLFERLLGKKKKPPVDSSDPIAKLREEVRADDDEVLPLKFTDAAPLMLRAFETGAKAEEPQPCFGFIHDADASWQLQGSNNTDVVRSFLLLRRFAESERFLRAGHVLVLATPTMSSLPEFFRRQDSPFTRIHLGRPDLGARLDFLQDVVVTEQMQVTVAKQAEEKRTRETEQKARLQAHFDSLTKERAAHRELRGSLEDTAAVVAARTAHQATVERIAELQCGIGQMRQRLTTEIAALGTIPAPMIDLDAAAWKRLRAGDEVVFIDSNKQSAISYRKRVLEVTAEGVALSLTSDLTRPTLDPKVGETVFFRFESGKLVQRKSGAEGMPFLPNNMVVRLVPEATAQIQDMQRQKRAELAGLENDTEAHANLQKELDEAQGRLEEARRMTLANWERRGEELTALVAGQEAVLRVYVAESAKGETKPTATVVSNLEAPFYRPQCGLDTAARLTQGMGYRDIIGLLRTAQANGLGCDEKVIRAARNHILARSFGHLLDNVEPAYGFEGLAGLENVIAFFRRIVHYIRTGQLGKVPMGVLLMGPPGSGKSALAEAFAKECGFLFVKLRNQRSMWNGETERQMEETLEAIRMLTPVVVYRDEVDQEDSGRDSFQGDNGVSARMRQNWMQFLSDTTLRGKVLVVSCTNRPDLLDAALKRSGRSDERIPILMPDHRTRVLLFPVMLRRLNAQLGDCLRWTSDESDYEALASDTEGRTGADIELIVRHAAEYAVHDGSLTVIGPEHLKQAVGDLMPPDSSEQIARMTQAALLACSRKEYLPSNLEEVIASCQSGMRAPAPPQKPSSTAENDDALRKLLELHQDEFPKA